MAKKKSCMRLIDNDLTQSYGLIYNQSLGYYTLKLPKNAKGFFNYKISSSDYFDICVDENKNIYFCRQFDICVFCGKQSKQYLFGKPVCRSCLKRLIEQEYDNDEVINNAD